MEAEDEEPEMFKRAPFRIRTRRIRLPAIRGRRLIRKVCKVVGVTADGRKFSLGILTKLKLLTQFYNSYPCHLLQKTCLKGRG